MIRYAKQRDAEQLGAWMLALLKHVQSRSGDPYLAGLVLEPGEAAEKMNAVILSEASISLVALEGDRPAGFVTGRSTPPFAGKETIGSIGYIDMIWVEPALRRLGVAGRLVRAIEDEFAAKGIVYVDLHYMAKDPSSARFWRSVGYEDYRVSARKKLG